MSPTSSSMPGGHACVAGSTAVVGWIRLPDRGHGARLQLPEGVLPRRVRRRDCERRAARCSPTTIATSATATGSRDRSSTPGSRCATTATRSRSRRRSTASIGPIASALGGAATPAVTSGGRRDRSTRRAACVSQVPTISGWESTLRRTSAAGASRAAARISTPTASSAFAVGRRRWCRWSSTPRRAGRPRTRAATPGTSSPAEHAPPGKDQWRFSKWRNEITLRSLELYSEYEPGSFIERIAPTPLLMVLRRSDTVCPTDLGLAAFNRAGEPKRLELYPGGHFSAYTDQFERAASAAAAWFAEHLAG